MNVWEVKSFKGYDGLKGIATDLDQLDRITKDHYDFSAAAIESYVRSFASESQLEIVTVYEGRRLIAALPLLLQQARGSFVDAHNLANEWFPGRFAAIDPRTPSVEVAKHLLHHLHHAGVSTLNCDWVNSEGTVLEAFQKSAVDGHLKHNLIPKFECGKIQLKSDWNEFTQDWSKSRRKLIRKSEKLLLDEGAFYAVAAHQLDRQTVEDYFDECLKIEDHSWKGSGGTSLLKNATALQFFRESMRIWYSNGQLRLYVLKSNGRPFAFDFGYVKNSVASSIKISYLPDFAKFSPGHVLNAFVVRDMMADPSVKWVDTLGELNEANRKWCQSSYTCQKLELALPGWMNNRRVQFKDWARTVKRVAQNATAAQLRPRT